MKQLIEEQKKEFEKKYNTSVLLAYPEYAESHMILLTDIWNWHKQSLKQFIDELIAREEKSDRETGFNAQYNDQFFEAKGFHRAKLETILHLKELKEELN